MSNLQNYCSNEDLSTAPWSFFHPSVSSFLSVSVKRCEKITKEGVNQGVAHLTYYVTKQPHAHVIYIINNASAVNTINRCLYYIVNFSQTK